MRKNTIGHNSWKRASIAAITAAAVVLACAFSFGNAGGVAFADTTGRPEIQAAGKSSAPAQNNSAPGAVRNSGNAAPSVRHPWLSPDAEIPVTILSGISVPEGYERISYPEGSFAAWLRTLPLKPDGTKVMLHDGRAKENQDAHFRVVDIDTGTRDLQQCADAVMRLRSEYLFAMKRFDDIAFNFSDGKRFSYKDFAGGDRTYAKLRKYHLKLYAYAGTYSLSREMKSVRGVSDIEPGMVFIKGGFPGHAVIVMDAARNAKSEKKIFLLAQSYMPAQDIHVLKNPRDNGLGPWYHEDFGEKLFTPEWVFERNQLKKF